MSTTDLRTIPNGAAHELAPIAAPDLVQDFTLLDAFAGGQVDEAPRLDALATISAGFRGPRREGNRPGLPQRSQDGTIFLHDPDGRAPGLAAALEATGKKRLTIAFPFDDPRLFIQQRFALYSATKLEIYGDERELRVIGERGMAVYQAGTEDYETQVRRCKVTVSVYFTLAEWGDGQPEVVMPDGLGMYRLRFTSRNSLRSIVGTLKHVARFSRGRVAGIPFDLALVKRDTSDGKGDRHEIPVWTITMKPPETMRLTSRTFADTLTRGLAQGSALMLPAPSTETLELAAAEGPDADLDEPSEDEAALIGRGGRCDRDYWRKRWHALVADTELDSDEARAAFLANYTSGVTRSLGEFLVTATEADASALIAEAADVLLAGAAESADPLRVVHVVRELLVSLTRPLSRDEFRLLAMQLPGLAERADISAALQVKDFMAWEAQGRGTWADALRILLAWVELQAAPSEPAVVDGDARETPPADGADHALDAEMTAVFGPQEEAVSADEAAGAAEDQPPFEDDRDPLQADADDTIAGLRDLAEKSEAKTAPATKSQLQSLSAQLGELGLANGQRARFVEVVFECPPTDLTFGQADVLLRFVAQPRARSSVQAVMAVYSGRSGLVEL